MAKIQTHLISRKIILVQIVTPVIYQILSAAGVLDNKAFVRNDLLRIIERVFSIDDESGGFEALATNTYWTREQLLRADFNELSTGFTDVRCLTFFFPPKKITPN